LRQSDFVARYGGEELIAIIHGSDSANAWKVAEKVRDNVEKTRFHYQEKIIRVTVSLGVTEVLPHDTDPEEPFKRVDAALYLAKEDGRNRIRVS
jgi:diguanylate cyclase